MGQKDYYAILGIQVDAGEEDIKSAFRQIALRHHPDKTGEEKSISLFRDAKEAYEVLNNPLKRKTYDSKREQGTRDGRAPARHRRGQDVTIRIKVRPDDVIGEVSKNIMTSRQGQCPACHGTGSADKSRIRCTKCGGSGIDVVSSVIGPRKFCAACKGFGDMPKGAPCKKCQGSGTVQEKTAQTVKLSRDNQSPIRIAGAGDHPPGGGTPGDLVVVLEIKKENLFEISGRNVKGSTGICPAQAVLGDTIFLDVFGNPVKIEIPAGTGHGTVIEKKDAGIGKGNKKGSLYLKVNIDIPQKPSGEEKELYTQLLKLKKGFL